MRGSSLLLIAVLPVALGLQVCRTHTACLRQPAVSPRVPAIVADIYERAEGDEGEVDVARVNELLEERNELRRARDFDAADEVRDELAGMGVTILDRDQVWYSGDRPKAFEEQCSARGGQRTHAP